MTDVVTTSDAGAGAPAPAGPPPDPARFGRLATLNRAAQDGPPPAAAPSQGRQVLQGGARGFYHGARALAESLPGVAAMAQLTTTQGLMRGLLDPASPQGQTLRAMAQLDGRLLSAAAHPARTAAEAHAAIQAFRDRFEAEEREAERTGTTTEFYAQFAGRGAFELLAAVVPVSKLGKLAEALKLVEAGKVAVQAGGTAARGLVYVDEASGAVRSAADLAARGFEQGAPNASREVATGRGIVPALMFDNANEHGAAYVRWDGMRPLPDGRVEMIDRKMRLLGFTTRDGKELASVEDQITRQRAALAQNPGFVGVIEVPNEAARAEAQDVLNRLNARDITVRVVPQ